MKTYNAIRSKWMRRASALVAVLMLTMSFSGYASARILFQDDATHDINSEGITLNADDGGDEDVTLQFGNDTTDATITFDDGTGDLTLATPSGGDFIIGSGTGLDFSGSDMFRIREDANPAGNAECKFVGELIYDTTDDELQICTAVADPGTWTAVDTTGGSIDLQGAYDNDAAGAHEIILSAGGTEAVEIRAQANGDDLLQLQNAAASPLINFQDLGGTTIDIDSLIVDWDATGAFSLDSTAGVHIGGANPSDFTVASDGAADDLTIAVTGATDSSVVISSSGTGTDAIDINATAGGIDVDTTDGAIAITAAGAANGDITLTSADTMTLDINGDGIIDIEEGLNFDVGANLDIDVEGTGAFTLNTVDGGITIDAAGAANGDVIIGAGDDLTLDAVGLLELNSSGGVINIGNDDVDQAINVGTTGERTITIGNTTGATALDLNANGAIGINSDDGSVTIGADDTDNAANDNVVLLSGNAAPDAGEDGNDIALEAEDDVLIEATGAFDVDAATADITTSGQFAISTSTWDISGAGAITGLTQVVVDNITIDGAAITSDTGAIDFGDENLTTTGDLIINGHGLTEVTSAVDSGAYVIGVFDEFDNSASVNVQDVLDDIDALIGTNAPNVDTMIFEPEYPNYVLWGDGGSNNGKMEALYDSANRENFYRWTTGKNAPHDYDIRFRYTLPDDYSAVGDLVTKIRTATTNPVITDNAVDITLRNDTDNTQCATSATNASSVDNTWRDITITAATIGNCGGQTLAAGDVIEIILHLQADDTNSGITDVGTISLAYTN